MKTKTTTSGEHELCQRNKMTLSGTRAREREKKKNTIDTQIDRLTITDRPQDTQTKHKHKDKHKGRRKKNTAGRAHTNRQRQIKVSSRQAPSHLALPSPRGTTAAGECQPRRHFLRNCLY